MALISTYTGRTLESLHNPEDARKLAIRLSPNIVLSAGTVLGEINATPGVFAAYNGAVLTAPATGPTLTAAAGALAAGTYTVGYTYVNANGQTTLSPTSAITLTASQLISVAAITPLPAGVDSVNWYVSDAPNSATLRFIVNNTGAAFTINALPAGGAATPPTTNTAESDTTGLQTARLLLEIDCATNASGKITYGTAANGGDLGETHETVAAYYCGTFLTTDLVGLDAAAVAELGRLISGTVANGILRMG